MDSDACSVERCARPKYESGYCQLHVQRARRGVDMLAPPITPGGGWCSFDACRRAAYSRGLCGGHYRQMRKGVPLHPLRPDPRAKTFDVPPPPRRRPKIASPKPCVIYDCQRPRRSNGMCSVHRSRAGRYNLSAIQLMWFMDVRRCDSCGGSLEPGKAHIDHDHACCPGERSCGDCIRGALCPGCNVGIGAFHENRHALAAAILYLEHRGAL